MRTAAEIASMAGLAPHPRDSGTLSKPRFVSGGRVLAKTTFCRAALSASKTKSELGAYYHRLIDAGKKPMVAMVALARKILVIANARLRDYFKTLSAIEAIAA